MEGVLVLIYKYVLHPSLCSHLTKKFEVYLMYAWFKFEFKYPNVHKNAIYATTPRKIDVTSGMVILQRERDHFVLW
jgi:hypothetical protein